MASITSKITVREMQNPVKILAGTSSFERAREKEQLACSWILKHGYVTADIIRRVVGQKAPGYENQLIKKGFIAKTKTTVDAIPRFFYTLTENGAAFAAKFVDENIDYKYFEPWRTKQNDFLKNFMIQEITLDAEEIWLDKNRKEFNLDTHEIKKNSEESDSEKKKNKFLQSYKTVHMYKLPSSDWRPDIRWQDQNGKWIGVAVELLGKSGRLRDLMVHRIVHAIENNLYDSIFFYSDNINTLKSYEAAFQPETKTSQWEAHDIKKGKWTELPESWKLTMPDDIIDHLFFRLIGKNYDNFDPRIEEQEEREETALIAPPVSYEPYGGL